MEGCCIVIFVIIIIAVIAAFGSLILYIGLVIYFVIHYHVVRIVSTIKRKNWEKTIKDAPVEELKATLADLQRLVRNCEQEIAANKHSLLIITDQWQQQKVSNQIDADNLKIEDAMEKIKFLENLLPVK